MKLKRTAMPMKFTLYDVLGNNGNGASSSSRNIKPWQSRQTAVSQLYAKRHLAAARSSNRSLKSSSSNSNPHRELLLTSVCLFSTHHHRSSSRTFYPPASAAHPLLHPAYELPRPQLLPTYGRSCSIPMPRRLPMFQPQPQLRSSTLTPRPRQGR